MFSLEGDLTLLNVKQKSAAMYKSCRDAFKPQKHILQTKCAGLVLSFYQKAKINKCNYNVIYILV